MIVLGVLLTLVAVLLFLATCALLTDGQEWGPAFFALALTAGVAVLADLAFGV
jgi:hypothetical protein